MNIGLFPMSGIRVCDAELLRLGLTLPDLWREADHRVLAKPRSADPGGMTPADIVCQYVEGADVNLLASLPGGLDLAAISTYSAQDVTRHTRWPDDSRRLGVPPSLEDRTSPPS